MKLTDPAASPPPPLAKGLLKALSPPPPAPKVNELGAETLVPNKVEFWLEAWPLVWPAAPKLNEGAGVDAPFWVAPPPKLNDGVDVPLAAPAPNEKDGVEAPAVELAPNKGVDDEAFSAAPPKVKLGAGVLLSAVAAPPKRDGVVVAAAGVAVFPKSDVGGFGVAAGAALPNMLRLA